MGGRKQLKRYAMPKAMGLPVKAGTWVTKPGPGPHPARRALPLRVLVRDVLKLARNSKEADFIIHGGKVKVDGRVRKDPAFPVGLMDVVAFPESEKTYRVSMNQHGRLVLVEIPAEESGTKLCRVTGKQVVRGGRIQLSLHDGRNVVGDFKEFKVGDVVYLSLEDSQVLQRLPLEERALALIMGGRNTGRTGRIVELRKSGQGEMSVVLESKGERLETSTKYTFVLGKEKPPITLGETGFEPHA
jgi:small subunit ribosomal protein S4e